MEFTLSLKVVAKCAESRLEIELRPDGLSQQFDTIESLVEEVREMTEGYFMSVVEEQYGDYLNGLLRDGQGLERLAVTKPSPTRPSAKNA